jgi:quinol monooxygenase YgiN
MLSLLPSTGEAAQENGTLPALANDMVFSIIKLYPAPRQRAQVIELLRSVQDLARPTPGCVGCWLSEEDVLQNHIRYAEQWETEAALHEHIRSDLYRRLLAAMELSKQPPKVKFYYCTESKGLELIEAVRRQPNPRSESDMLANGTR